jgi:expansin (peptidoglycan-binding protein)
MHATPSSRPPSRRGGPWLIVLLAAIGVIVMAAGVVHFAPGSCAAPRQAAAAVQAGQVQAGQGQADPGSAPTSGEAVFYNPGLAEDRCSIEPLAPDGLYASLPAGQYRDGTECGAYLDVTGPLGTVQAEIIDMCPGCAADQLDLSTAAFARIQPTSAGTAQVTYQLAHDPALPGPLAVRVGSGSTAGSLAIQVLNHGNPLSAVQVDGKPLTLRPDGYWVAPDGAGPGPFQVQVTDALGNNAVLTGITLRPGALQQTGVPMYTPATTPPQPAPDPAPAPPTPSPSPSPSPGTVAQRAPATTTASC